MIRSWGIASLVSFGWVLTTLSLFRLDSFRMMEATFASSGLDIAQFLDNGPGLSLCFNVQHSEDKRLL